MASDALNDNKMAYYMGSGGVVPVPPVTVNKVPSWSDVGNTDAASIAAWTLQTSNVTVQSGQLDASGTTSNAAKVTVTGAGAYGVRVFDPLIVATSSPFTTSIYFKAGTGGASGNTAYFAWECNAGVASISVNLTSGAVTVVTPLAGYTWTSVLSGGWVRLIGAVTGTLSVGEQPAVYYVDASQSPATSVNYFVYGLQVEAGSPPTTPTAYVQVLA